MKNYFYFILKVFVLRIFNFLPDLFGQVGKRFDKKAMVDLKIYDVTTWQTNNYNTRIAQYLKK